MGIDRPTVRKKPTFCSNFSKQYTDKIKGTWPNTRSRHPYDGGAGRSDHEGRSVVQQKIIDARKAAGPDGIKSAKVRPLAEVLLKPCTQLLNASLDEGCPPRS